jgi:cephalosporin-C deacetylase
MLSRFFSFLIVCFAICLTTINLKAQQSINREYVTIQIVPDKADWTYKVNEEAIITLRVLRANSPLSNVPLTYEYGPEKMAIVKKGDSKMEKGEIVLKIPGMTTPGFTTITCHVEVDGTKYTNYLNIGFSPNEIQPTTTLPSDFTEFWEKAKTDTRKIPMEPLLTLMPELCTPKVNVYHVQLQHYKTDTYWYGMLCIPKKAGKYPAILRVPGAGVRKQPAEIGLAEQGFITFSVGIHGIPLDQDDKIYNNLRFGVLDRYAFFNLDDKDYYYYRRVYTGCVRSIDFLSELPEYDGKNIGVIGNSQGGALAIITASLDERVKALVSYHPALCDLTGDLNGRTGGWPQMFSEANKKLTRKPDKIETSKYYDVVNFARSLKTPGYYSWGYNDNVCPPTSVHAAYNIITAPKESFIALETGHWLNKEQTKITTQWLMKQLNSGK